MHVEKRYVSGGEISAYCVINDEGTAYPFGDDREAVEIVLRRMESRSDVLETYGSWPDSISELDHCKEVVKKRYLYSWGMDSIGLLGETGYVIYAGNGAGTILARAYTEIEAWRQAEEQVKREIEIDEIVRERRPGNVPYKVKETVVECYGPWTTVSDFRPEHPESVDIDLYRTYDSGKGSILLGSVRGQEDGEWNKFSSTCTKCCFTTVSDGFMVTCPSCGTNGGIYHYPRY